VTQKSNIRTWSNSRGEGKLFNIVIVDESGEIRATAFNSEVEKFYNLIDVNKVGLLVTIITPSLCQVTCHLRALFVCLVETA